MIYPVLKFLAEQLNQYIEQVKKPGDGITNPVAILQNISRLNEDDLETTNNIILSLVNLQEEAAMKNNPGQVVMNSEVVRYDNPPVNLNLYLLITACMTNYENALIYLTHAITFFQGKNIFNKQNSITHVEGLPDNFRIITDLHSLTLEQVNFLWSTLGGKQHPFVCYRLRLLQLTRPSTTETRGVIRQVRIEETGV